MAFLVLHEVTAVVPLVGLAGLFHWAGWVPGVIGDNGGMGKYVTEGVERFGRYFGRKGWFGFEPSPSNGQAVEGGNGLGGNGDTQVLTEQEVEEQYNVGSRGGRVLIEVATAYAITKVLLPVRVVLSVWGTPWFARAVVGRIGGWLRRIRGAGRIGTRELGAGVKGVRGLPKENGVGGLKKP